MNSIVGSIEKVVTHISAYFIGILHIVSSTLSPVALPTPTPLASSTPQGTSTILTNVTPLVTPSSTPVTTPKTTTSTQPTTQKPASATTAPSLFPTLTLPKTPPPFAPFIPASTTVATPKAPTWSDIENKTRNAVVNIVCFNASLGYIRATTGSGVIIDPRGIILTNAHIGQYFLLSKNNGAELPEYNCTIRKGNVASAAYHASLIYLPSDWLEENPTLYKSNEATGTGESDYALLQITSSTNPTQSLPSSFPFVSFNVTPKIAEKNTDILLAGYPVGNLGVFSLESKLALVSHVSTIVDEFTFNRSSLDLVATEVTTLAKQGSSGGAMVNNKGELIGLLVSTGNRNGYSTNLNALTLSYINTDLEDDTNKTLREFISGNTQTKIADFEKKAARLRKLFD